jgi:iron complex transport system permease protein
MKIVLDIAQLVKDGELSAAQAERLRALAIRETGSFGINILLAFGVVAVAGGIIALYPSEEVAFAIGAILVGCGLALQRLKADNWGPLGAANVMIGALTVSASLVLMLVGSALAYSLVTLILLGLGIVTRSGLLTALSVFALAALLGSSTGYMHAAYFLIIREATIVIVVFSVLALGVFILSKRLSAPFERLALIYSRVCLILVNFGFWVGSLWGDYPGESWLQDDIFENSAAFWNSQGEWRGAALFMSDVVFVVLWALALMAVGAWGVRTNRRFVVNTAVVFAAIHFYTQWFERLGAMPSTIIISGVIAIALAVGLWKYNRLEA